MSQEISEIYSNYDSYRPEVAMSPQTCYFDANIGALIADLKLSKDARILEIGSGSGGTLKKLQKIGYTNLESFDICENYRSDLRKQGFTVHDGNSLEELLSNIDDDQYDLLLAEDVFEHVEKFELQSFLKNFHPKLKKGGAVVGQVPNSSGLFGHNTFLGDYTHVTPFNEVRLESLLLGCGYRDVMVRDARLPRGMANLVRTALRTVIFKFAFLLSRVVGASPVRCFAHLIVFQARKRSVPERNIETSY